MKKLTSSSLIIIMMILIGIISTAEARTGSTSDSSSSSKSRSTTSKTTTSSKPSKTTSATNSIFANAAKNNEASKAWQKINKKPVDNTPVAVAPVPAPVQNNDNNTSQQLADIQRQLAENKRQQQIADAARFAAEMAARNNNNRPQPAYVTPATVTPPVANVTNTATDSAPAKSGGTSWFMIFLIIGGIVVIYFWLKNRNSSNTNYRL